MQQDQPSMLSRRQWLLATGALAAGTQHKVAQASLKTKARIVIAGSGLAGIAMASRLRRELDGASITIIDGKTEHHYQPGYTLVASGVWSKDKVLLASNVDHLPSGVEWVREMVAEFDPVNNTVVTAGGRKIPYDFLIVATGLHLDYAQIEGMDVAAIGQNGLGSVYPSPQAAEDTWRAMDAFRRKGGRAVVTLPSGPLKCAGAPLKMTFMLADRLRQAGTLGRSTVELYTGLPDNTVFGVKAVNEDVIRRWNEIGIRRHHLQKLVAIDIGGRKATFANPEGEKTQVEYDFIHVVPPMRAPDVVKKSPLAWQDGPMAPGGWLEVDKETLRHRRFPNVFGIGDINGTPRGKTAATVKKSAPMLTQNVIDVIAGREPSQRFDGYTSCPLIVREGAAMLIEFDYEGRFTPSMPMIEPMQAGFFGWLLKYRMLKPAYVAVLKGRV